MGTNNYKKGTISYFTLILPTENRFEYLFKEKF